MVRIEPQRARVGGGGLRVLPAGFCGNRQIRRAIRVGQQLLLDSEQRGIRRLRLSQAGEQGGAGVGRVRVVGLQSARALEADKGLFRLIGPVQRGPLLHESLEIAGWVHDVNRSAVRSVFSV